MNNSNYAHVGRWSRCLWCGTIYQPQKAHWIHVEGGNMFSHDEAHWCNAPWQQYPKDIPEEWVAGPWSEVTKHYPQSPFAIFDSPEVSTVVGIPCS